MNEELKPLEAFERIKDSLDYYKSYAKDILPTKAKIIDEEDKDELQIIENALKEHELMKQTKFIVADKKISEDDLEKLKNQRMFVGNLEQCEIKPLFDEETKKKLKALEIIKKKNVDFKVLKSTFACKREKEIQCKIYNLNQWQWVYELEHPGCTNLNKDKLPRLTQEEYDLLKEVLKND